MWKRRVARKKEETRDVSASRHWYTSLYWFLIWNFTFFDLWPLNRRSDKEVTVDSFACFPKAYMLTSLVLPFDVVWNLTFFDRWPLNRRSGDEVTVDAFASWPKAYMLAPLVLPFDVVWNLTFIFDLLTPNDPGHFFKTITFVEKLKVNYMHESHDHAT